MLRWFESTSSHQNEILFKKYLVSFLYKHYNKPRWWIRTARARRFASRRAKTPLRGVFRARLGGSTSSHQNEILFKKYLVSFLYRHYNKLRWWIRTARARRFTSRRAKTPMRGVFRARLGESTSSHQNEALLRSISF